MNRLAVSPITSMGSQRRGTAVRFKISTTRGKRWRNFWVPETDRDSQFLPVVLLKDCTEGSAGDVVLVHRIHARNQLVRTGCAVFGTWENIDNFSKEGQNMWAERFSRMEDCGAQRGMALPDVDDNVPRSEDEMSINHLVNKKIKQRDEVATAMRCEGATHQLPSVEGRADEATMGQTSGDRTSHRYRYVLPSFAESQISAGLRPLYDGACAAKERRALHQHNIEIRTTTPTREAFEGESVEGGDRGYDNDDDHYEIDSDLRRTLLMSVTERRSFFNSDLDEEFGDWREASESVFEAQHQREDDGGKENEATERYLRNVDPFSATE